MRIHPTPAREIAQLIQAKVLGNAEQKINGFNEIHRVNHGDCVFVDHPKYYEKALRSAATAVIINAEVPVPEGKVLLVCDEPFSAFNTLTRHFNPRTFSNAAIASSAIIGANVQIGHGCVIGEHVSIGDHCVLHPNVVIYDGCVIGSRVAIHANTTIGSDAFYFKKRSKAFEPLYSCGHVVIEDDVVIGSNCSIDRGVTDVTFIGKATILDNHIHIGHDVLIGEMCLFAAQVGIAGACTIGNRVTVWGQVGISSGITIGDGATILAQSGVGENVPEGKTYFGSPAGEAKSKMREVAALKQLPEFLASQRKNEDR